MSYFVWTRWGRCFAVLPLLGLGLGSAACVLASPDFDAPTESDATASTPGSTGESESGVASGSPASTTSSGSAGSGTEGQTTGTTVGTTGTGATTVEPTTGSSTGAPTTGTTTEASTTSGTSDGGGVCDLSPGSWSVGEAVPVSELNSDDTEADPVLLSDGKTLLFSSNRVGGLGSFDSYYAVRSGFGEPFGPAINIEGAYGWNADSSEGKAELRGGGLELVFSSNWGGAYELWRGVRGSTDVPFPGFSVIDGLQQGARLDPHLSADGLRVYYAQGVGGHYDLAFTERPELGADFGPTVLLSELNTGESEANPSLSEDQTLLLFARRTGDQIDLYYTHRPDADAVFGPEQPLAELNTGVDDAEPYLVEHEGQCELFFVSNRGDGADWDLYRAPIVSN